MKNSNKKRIAVIGLKGLPPMGGAATAGENIIKNLQNDYDFTVFSISSHTQLRTGFLDYCYQKVFRKVPLGKLNTLYYYLISVFYVLIKKKYHLIHLNHSDAAFLIPLLRLRYRVIVTTRGAQNSGLTTKWIKYRWYFQSQLSFLKFADRVTCVSKVERDLFKNKYNLTAIHIPNGINLNENIQNSKKEYDIFFGAGRIMRSKGCDLLLKALAKISFRGSVIIAGNLDTMPDYSKELHELAKGLNVKFTGLIRDKTELLTTISSSELFVYPSLLEAMSNMLLEGASVKVPIICSDIRENQDVFCDNEVLFFKTNDIDDLADKIKWALDNPDKMHDYAQSAYEKLKKQYLWPEIARKYKEVYEQLFLIN